MEYGGHQYEKYYYFWIRLKINKFKQSFSDNMMDLFLTKYKNKKLNLTTKENSDYLKRILKMWIILMINMKK